MGVETVTDEAGVRGITRGEFADYSLTVRDSTLKRLKAVPEGFENWRPHEAALSFADVAHHLRTSDTTLMAWSDTYAIGKNLGRRGLAGAPNRTEYDALVAELEESGFARRKFLDELTDEQWNTVIEVDRITGKESTPFWLLALRFLDHEIHHRGQIALYLTLLDKQA